MAGRSSPTSSPPCWARKLPTGFVRRLTSPPAKTSRAWLPSVEAFTSPESPSSSGAVTTAGTSVGKRSRNRSEGVRYPARRHPRLSGVRARGRSRLQINIPRQRHRPSLVFVTSPSHRCSHREREQVDNSPAAKRATTLRNAPSLLARSNQRQERKVFVALVRPT